MQITTEEDIFLNNFLKENKYSSNNYIQESLLEI